MLSIRRASLLFFLLPACLAAQNSISIDQIVLQYPENLPPEFGGEFSGKSFILTPGGGNRFPPVFALIEAVVTISYSYDTDDLDHLSQLVRGTIDRDGPISASCSFRSDPPGSGGGVASSAGAAKPELPKTGSRQGSNAGFVLPTGALSVNPNETPATVSFTCFLRARGGLTFGTTPIAESEPIVGLLTTDLTTPAEPQVDVQVGYIEVTQAIQDDNNNIRLVADKATLARVFIKPGDLGPPSPNRVEAILFGFPADSDEQLPGSPLRPNQRFLPSAPALQNHNHEIAGHSVNFILPEDWTRAGRNITLLAEVDPEGKIDNELRDNNQGGQEDFKFFKRENLSIGYMPVCVELTPGAEPKCPKPERYADVEGLLNRIYPLADGDALYFPLPMPDLMWKGDLDTPEQRAPLRQRLRKLYDLLDLLTGGGLDQLAVWVAPAVSIGRFDSGSKIGGFAGAKWAGGGDGIGRMTFMRAGGGLQSLLAHEVAHNLGLRHPDLGAGSCGSADSNSDWPHPSDSIQDVGYDPTNSLLFRRPKEFKDLMSYCRPQWISPFHYNQLFDANSRPQGLRPEKLQGVPQSYWVISGSVRADGSGARLDPAYRVTSRTAPDPTADSGEYCLQLSGAAAATRCVNLTFREPETGFALDAELFTVRVPDPGGVTKIALLRNGAQIAALNQSAAAPVVQVTSPAPGDVWDGGQRSVRWTSADADGDPLTYSVLYSPDGGDSWLPVEVDTAMNECMVDTTKINGGNDVRFRVLATDGLNTTEMDVGPITVRQRPEIAAAPPAPNLGGSLVGVTRYAAVTLTNPGTGPLTVTAVRGDNAAFQISGPQTPFSVPAGSQRNVSIEFTPPAVGSHVATLTVDSNAATRPSLGVAIEGVGVSDNAPFLEISADRLDLGDAPVGGSATQIVVVTNPGGADLNIQLAAQGGGFSFENVVSPTAIPAGGMLEVTIRFTPVAAGDAEGVFIVTSDDPTRPRAELALSGSGFVRAGAPSPTPAINAGGVVDAAQFQAMISPGGIGSIFGVNLAAAVAGASGAPLPTNLAGVQVLVDGVPAPLFFVSPGQINFQAPFEIGFGNVQVVVVRNGVQSPPRTVSSKLYSPSVFVNQANGFAIVQRPGDGSLITAAAPAKAGEALIFYITGIGGLDNPPASGAASPASPLSIAQLNPTLTLGGAAANVFFAGLAPSFVGLGQLNAFLPDPLPAASAARIEGAQQGVATLPLVIDFGGSSSVPVQLPVESTGPPPAGVDVGVTLNQVFPSMPVTADPADTLTVRYSVTNPGAFDGAGVRRLYLSTDPTISPTTDTLLNERTLTFRGNDLSIDSRGNQLPEGIQPRTYYIGVEVIIPGDANLVNNLSSGLRIDVIANRPPFDLSIDALTFEPPIVGAGDPVSIRYEASGPATLSGTFTRAFYLSADEEITAQDTVIDEGRFSMVEGAFAAVINNNFIPRSTAPGNYFIGAILQPQGDVNLSNNATVGLPVTVTATRTPFDLAVEARAVSPRTVAQGGTIEVTYRVTNRSAANGVYRRSLYVSTDATISTADTFINRRTFELDGQSSTLTSRNNRLPSLPPGEYFVGVILESADDTSPADNVSNGRGLTISAGAALRTVEAFEANKSDGEISRPADGESAPNQEHKGGDQ